MIPSPTTPMFVCFRWDADTGRSIGSAVQRSACRQKWVHAIQKFSSACDSLKRSLTRCHSERSEESLAISGRRSFRASGYLTLQSEFREIIESNRADNLETLRANLVHCIICGVPPGIIEINDVDRWNPKRIQRRVIVNHVPVQVAEVFPKLHCFGRGKDIARHRGR